MQDLGIEMWNWQESVYTSSLIAYMHKRYTDLKFGSREEPVPKILTKKCLTMVLGTTLSLECQMNTIDILLGLGCCSDLIVSMKFYLKSIKQWCLGWPCPPIFASAKVDFVFLCLLFWNLYLLSLDCVTCTHKGWK